MRSPEELYNEYRGRRTAILRALTSDVDRFYQACDPERENLCLYAHPDGTWSVDLPCEEVPPELPEPALGINFARDGMQRQDWLALVAVHSDSWLLSLAFYKGARFNREQRCALPPRRCLRAMCHRPAARLRLRTLSTAAASTHAAAPTAAGTARRGALRCQWPACMHARSPLQPHALTPPRAPPSPARPVPQNPAPP
jgi:hypothetical protein